MSSDKPAPLLVHGWTLFAHPLFLAQIEALARQVEALKQKDPVGGAKKNATKRLAAITRLAFDPNDQMNCPLFATAGYTNATPPVKRRSAFRISYAAQGRPPPPPAKGHLRAPSR